MCQPQPIVVDHPTPHAFLDYILTTHAPPTTLIVCSTRATFAAQLSAALLLPPPLQPAKSHSQQSLRASAEPPALLQPTLGRLHRARSVSLAFCATLSHLRAYLAAFEPQPTLDAAGPEGVPVLALLNPLALHRGTAEFSAQGLGRTFAAAVEAASRWGMRLVVCECEGGEEEGGGVSGVGEGAVGFWEEEVPVLNGAIGQMGGQGGRNWAGRRVRIEAVVGRWCRFEKQLGLGGGDRDESS